ncbi:MAG TPA: hypothetical protein PKE69_03980 [Pyrinomonadaceae bacterium]|nr:hypothetical protein [Pyrinomonadaceae bacterium]
MQRNSRGGAKPSMLGNKGNPLTIQINGIDRKDWYELSKDEKSLARRAELPTWLSEKARQIKAERKSLLAELSENNIRNSNKLEGESGGHILINAKQNTRQEIPCIGIDVEIIEKLKDNPPDRIYFFVYYIDYIICEKWSVSWNDFISNGFEVKSSERFTPQSMIPVKYLSNNMIT